MQFLQHGFVSSHFTWRRLQILGRYFIQDNVVDLLAYFHGQPYSARIQGSDYLHVTQPVRTLANLARVARRCFVTAKVVIMDSPGLFLWA